MEETETYVLGGERRPDPPRKRNYAGHERRTHDRARARMPPNLAKYPGLPAGAFAEPVDQTIYGNRPGCPYYHEVGMILDSVDTVRTGLSAALDRWQRILDAAREADDPHIQQRAKNELDGIYAVLQKLSCRCP